MIFRSGLRWDIQAGANWWLSLGIHIDHKDPSITLHLPGVIITIGRCGTPMNLVWLNEQMLDIEDPDSFEIANSPVFVWGIYSLRDLLGGQ